ncbi:hypothetical protein TB147_17725 [Klebsiella aerogenes]|uniref:hypothetical protein n=1 Tax=Klebsiella aerogenes TaxID=548 RepID=UPI002E35E366|nr:hypothetical protein [Klebsiella aerogenes]MED7793144.1 hypothetical protein [Klebsiella aerogenes]
MRYWIIVVLYNGLFSLAIYFAEPEIFGTPLFYAGMLVCTLISAVITWRDPPCGLDKLLLVLVKWSFLSASVAFFVWGAGYKMGFWGARNPDELASGISDSILPNLALVTGVLVIVGIWLRIRKH